MISSIFWMSTAYSIELTSWNESDNEFIVATISPDTDRLEQFWLNPVTNKPYGSISTLAKALSKQGKQLEFAINSGIFSKDQRPLGWYIEHGEKLQSLNVIAKENAKGNFSLVPNGVFFIDKDGSAHILETHDFLAKQDQFQPKFATQSGPILLVNGEMHPRFIKGSDSLKYRSGVCVDPDNKVQFVVTQTPINFYDFALFFKNRLKCENALYLDGTLSQLYFRGRFYGAPFWNVRPYVGMWGVTVPEKVGESE